MESAYLSEDMIVLMLQRWSDQHKPLFLTHKEFKDQMLAQMDQEVKLNYQKWLQQTLDIDVFEVLTMLIIYTRCPLDRKFKRKYPMVDLPVLFKLYSFDKTRMSHNEIQFMVGKVSCALANTYQFKKSYLHDLAEHLREEILPTAAGAIPRSAPLNIQSRDEQGITQGEFVKSMTAEFQKFRGRVLSIETLIENFAGQLCQQRLPAYLRPGERFLGKYAVQATAPHWHIMKHSAMTYGSVFKARDLERSATVNQKPKKITGRGPDADLPADDERFNHFDFFSLDNLFEETQGILKRHLYKQLTAEMPEMPVDVTTNDRKRRLWQKQVHHLCIGGLEYSYRIYVHNMFPKKNERNNYKMFFDLFVVDDPRFFDQHFARQNFFRETILMKFLNNPRIQNVGLFGQLPGGIVYR